MNYSYLARETFTNLRRNVMMTVGAIITMGVSLSLVGGAFLLKQGVGNATQQWRNGIEMSVFMKIDSTQDQRDVVEARLKRLQANNQVKRYFFVNQNETLDEFRRLFRNSPDLTANVRAKDLPPSFRVVPTDPQTVERFRSQFVKEAGVQDVTFFDVEGLLDFTGKLQFGILAVASLLLFSAIVLILTTIQIAIFARRREIAVMKLVGATNWFIRVPFMMEGMLQGVIGGLASCGLIYTLWKFLANRALNGDCDPTAENQCLFLQLLPVGSEVLTTSIGVLFLGAFVGALGSGFAVRKFLDV